MEKEVKNCWEFMGCGEEARNGCDAFRLGEGGECWFIASNYCQPKIKRDFSSCVYCPWYKKFNK